jgi:2,5-diamino-6-(ribosylamino)-4(3H)-pyrimidinone 5'-phosphate reductase
LSIGTTGAVHFHIVRVGPTHLAAYHCGCHACERPATKLPRVLLHNAVSLDGRIDWITPDIGRFYELAGRWDEDAALVGADTLLAPEPGLDDTAPPPEPAAAAPPPAPPDPTKPRLVVTDSRGRVRNWPELLNGPYWSRGVALCSERTPAEYFDYLDSVGVDHIIAGENRVDLRAALAELAAKYGIARVRVDSGGRLNGALLRAGLIDEVSLLVHPYLVGGESGQTFFRAPDLTSAGRVINLRLIAAETLEDDLLWLRYELIRG